MGTETLTEINYENRKSTKRRTHGNSYLYNSSGSDGLSKKDGLERLANRAEAVSNFIWLYRIIKLQVLLTICSNREHPRTR